MKRKILVALLSLTLLIGACASQTSSVEASAAKPTAPAPAPQGTPSAGSPAGQKADENTAVPVPFEMAFGLLKLEGTSNALTQAQAEALLPLWTSYQTLIESSRPQSGQDGQPADGATPQPPAADNDLQTQVDDIITQIKAQLTSAQLQAIADMKITRESAATIMQDLGITVTGPDGAAQGQNGNTPQGNPPANAPQGSPQGQNNGAQQGNPPAGAPQGNPPSGQPDGQGQQGTGMDGRQPGGPGMGFMPSELLDKLISLLETRSGS